MRRAEDAHVTDAGALRNLNDAHATVFPYEYERLFRNYISTFLLFEQTENCISLCMDD